MPFVEILKLIFSNKLFWNLILAGIPWIVSKINQWRKKRHAQKQMQALEKSKTENATEDLQDIINDDLSEL